MKLKNENERIISSYSVMSHPKVKRKIPITEEEKKKSTEDLIRELKELKIKEFVLFNQMTYFRKNSSSFTSAK